VERAGPSVEVKIVILVVGVVVVQDLVLLAMFLGRAPAVAAVAALAGTLVISIIIAAVWGNTVARAVRRLTRACYVARHGDVRVLAEPSRTDEIGELNDEINSLIISLRERAEAEGGLAAGRGLADTIASTAPDIIHGAHEILVSLKELREGAAAEATVFRKIAGALAEARTYLAQTAGEVEGGATSDEIGATLRGLGSAAREADLLADAVIDEVARETPDEAALARSVNGLRGTVRRLAEAAESAAGVLEQRRADARAASAALERLREAELEKSGGGRVAELMEASAARGFSEATRLASSLRRLGVAIEAYEERRRQER
jgi:HAMP domain-containing protein